MTEQELLQSQTWYNITIPANMPELAKNQGHIASIDQIPDQFPQVYRNTTTESSTQESSQFGWH